jgi:hypothetical protein
MVKGIEAIIKTKENFKLNRFITEYYQLFKKELASV